MKTVIFFIEGREHERFLYPYIEIFKKLCSDVRILSLENLSKTYVHHEKFINIDKKNLSKTLLNLECDYLITTTPGVGNSYFPKSIVLNKLKRPKYVYVFHSLVSPNQVYSKKSFSGFDIILAPNRVISQQLKPIVSGETVVHTVGYPLLTNNHYLKFNNNIGKEKKVLLAPSWGKDSLLNNNQLMNNLLNLINNSFQVTLRPHPMEIHMAEKFKNHEFIKIDDQKDLTNLIEYDYLITDWSGIGIEYSIITNNKTIYINTPKKERRKLNKSEKNFLLIENQIRKSAGIEIDLKNLALLKETLDSPLNKITDMAYLRLIKEPIFDKDIIHKIFQTNSDNLKIK